MVIFLNKNCFRRYYFATGKNFRLKFFRKYLEILEEKCYFSIGFHQNIFLLRILKQKEFDEDFLKETFSQNDFTLAPSITSITSVANDKGE